MPCLKSRHSSGRPQEVGTNCGVPEKDIKEFVIIGNGPSGMSLSYLLSGNWPYYSGGSQDEMLHARLMTQPHLSLVEQDLEFLSDGLEGRSSNPVSLLLDCLQCPDADLGLELPSLLEWRHHESRRVDHVVLGRGKPGGVWQTLDGDMLTVSLGAWMQLPNLTMQEWNLSSKKDSDDESLVNKRSTIACVSQYYTDYAHLMGINQNFRNNTVVTSVRQLCRGYTREKPASTSLTLGPSFSTANSLSVAKPNQPVQIHGKSSSAESHHKDDGAGSSSNWQEEMFTIDDEDLSSDCSSLTHSASPIREDDASYSRSYARSAIGERSREAGDLQTEDDVEVEARLPSIREPSSIDNDSGLSSLYSQLMDMRSSAFEGDVCPSWDPILNPSLFSCAYLTCGSYGSRLTCSKPSASSLTAKQDSCFGRWVCDGTLFEVSGYEITQSEAGTFSHTPFTYFTRNVVLATGMDRPNHLGVPGEHLPFVLHSLKELGKAVESGGLTPNSDPVMIIGAGLSAADAILSAKGHKIPVVHVFRRSVDDPTLIFNKLPKSLYPEYEKVHHMMGEGSLGSSTNMKGEEVEREFPDYTSYPLSSVLYITQDRTVKLAGPNTDQEIKVSYVLVLVGATPNLDFLEAGDGGKLGGIAGNPVNELGRIPGQPVDKNNPIDIDAFTHQSVHVPGLFAMGPLTGDNFVRFLQGGALAITAFAHQQTKTLKPYKESAY